MKKILIIICLFVCTQTVFAQLEKGMTAVGITSQLYLYKNTNETNNPSSSSDYTNKTTQYSILPTINYFISSKYSIGLQLGYSGATITSSTIANDTVYSAFLKGNSKSTSGGITVSPTIKYYIPVNDNIFFFLNGACSLYLGNGKYSNSSQSSFRDPNNGNITNSSSDLKYKTETVGMSVGISPGVLFMPGKKIGFEFSLGNIIAYNHRIEKRTYENYDHTRKSSTSGLDFININSFSAGTSLYYFF